ncbi:MAG: hypothetical protein H5T86_12065 [Armatimonadetes bacterium]|nr:hypothetical protein [Armatimonadota bacterium]
MRRIVERMGPFGPPAETAAGFALGLGVETARDVFGGWTVFLFILALLVLIILMGFAHWAARVLLDVYRGRRPVVDLPGEPAAKAKAVVSGFSLSRTAPDLLRRLLEYHDGARFLYILASREAKEGAENAKIGLQQNFRDVEIVIREFEDAFDEGSVAEVARGILAELAARNVSPVSVDVTLGTVPMSLGLLSAATKFGAEPTYTPAARTDAAGRAVTAAKPRRIAVGWSEDAEPRRLEETRRPEGAESQGEKGR